MDPVAHARQFFQQNGRDVDRARFDFHFGALPLGALLAILGQYQNPDGGWPTPYDWGWRGWVTVQSLLVLRAFGRA